MEEQGKPRCMVVENECLCNTRIWSEELTDKPISDSLQFHTAFKFWVAKDFSRDAILPHVPLVNSYLQDV